MPTKRILKLTNQEAIIKIDGTNGPVTIDLSTDLLLPTEEIFGTPKVSIVSMHVAGKAGALATVTRNGDTLWDLQASTAEKIDLLSLGGVVDNTHEESDITVTTTLAEAQLLMKLRKTSGYRTRIRPEQTGLDTPV